MGLDCRMEQLGNAIAYIRVKHFADDYVIYANCYPCRRYAELSH